MAFDHPHRILAVAVLLGVAFCCSLLVSSAQARSVSGTQTVIDEDAGTFRMHGDLVGVWTFTSFKELATTPVYRAKGAEKFRGCLDRGHDGGCAGDPTGTLRMKFRYWAMFGPGDALLAGACWHPIVGGTGAFRRARGAFEMIDVPTANGVETHYVGDIRMRGGASVQAARSSCGG